MNIHNIIGWVLVILFGVPLSVLIITAVYIILASIMSFWIGIVFWIINCVKFKSLVGASPLYFIEKILNKFPWINIKKTKGD